jgi:SAM-dependent methyltransferase
MAETRPGLHPDPAWNLKDEIVAQLAYAREWGGRFVVAIPRVQDGLLWPSQAAALGAPTGDIELVFCPKCGYIGNRAFDPEKLRYDPSYDISLHYSPVYRDFIAALVDRLARDLALSGKTVLEIGSGKGDFLHALCQRAGCQGVGFDPTSTAQEPAGSPVRVVRDFYSERYADEPADLVCCRHVLNSIADLRGFLGTLRRTLGPRTRSVVYCEVPDGAVIFRQARRLERRLRALLLFHGALARAALHWRPVSHPGRRPRASRTSTSASKRSPAPAPLPAPGPTAASSAWPPRSTPSGPSTGRRSRAGGTGSTP